MRFMRKGLLGISSAVVMAGLSSLAWGQKCPDFKGTWASYGQLPDQLPGSIYSCTFNTDSDGNIVAPSGCDIYNPADGSLLFGGGATGQYVVTNVNGLCKVSGSLDVGVATLSIIDATLNRSGTSFSGIETLSGFGQGVIPFSFYRVD